MAQIQSSKVTGMPPSRPHLVSYARKDPHACQWEHCQSIPWLQRTVSSVCHSTGGFKLDSTVEHLVLFHWLQSMWGLKLEIAVQRAVLFHWLQVVQAKLDLAVWHPLFFHWFQPLQPGFSLCRLGLQPLKTVCFLLISLWWKLRLYFWCFQGGKKEKDEKGWIWNLELILYSRKLKSKPMGSKVLRPGNSFQKSKIVATTTTKDTCVHCLEITQSSQQRQMEGVPTNTAKGMSPKGHHNLNWWWRTFSVCCVKKCPVWLCCHITPHPQRNRNNYYVFIYFKK